MTALSATPSPSRPSDEGQVVLVTIGPVDARAALAWINDAVAFLAVIDQDPSVDVPEIVTTVVRRLVGEWRAAITREEFVWASEVPVTHLRALASHWAGVAAKVRQDQSSVAPRRPSADARAFYDAMVAGVASALAAVDGDQDGFASAFVGVMPGFDKSVPGPLQTATTTRVLVVDDTDDIRLLLRIALDADGRFEVVGEAREGREAIKKANHLQPDAILLDLAMPDMDGLTALPALLAGCPNSRIVIFSADHAAREDVLAAGAHAFVAKKESIDILAAALLAE